MNRQVTNTVLMIRPRHIEPNPETASTNFYQKETNLPKKEILKRAEYEFDELVNTLKSHGVNVFVVQDSENPITPDAHFPNNWISFHQNGDIGVYPMLAKSRRDERRADIFDFLEAQQFNINSIFDYTSAEEEELFLEGTGSLVLDRVNRKAYCAISPRSNEDLFIEFCEDFEYTPVLFEAMQTVEGERRSIYHTNVMMSIGKDLAIVCIDSIDNKSERKNLLKHLREDNKTLIVITESQVSNFAGNMLQLENDKGVQLMVMSKRAMDSLRTDQIEKIEKFASILSSDIQMIETCGGGSVRCMIAEVFLPKTEGN